ncbi:MAG TPA: thiamine diphosphokinase [Bacteroidota bacterium]|nr:thiamine diphosphokinase [Bacteroidota bacterium]
MTALIIANGTLPSRKIVSDLARQADLIVCADGGANHALRLGIRPDLILGDLDSVTKSTLRAFRRVPLGYVDDQNSTDLEKTIRYCIHRGCRIIHVTGGFGSRIDHATGSIGCVRRFMPKCTVILHDESGYLMPVGRKIRVATRTGEMVSLIPLTKCTGVTTSNLHYPLNNSTLEMGVREGIHNIATGRIVQVSLRRGFLLLYRVRNA